MVTAAFTMIAMLGFNAQAQQPVPKIGWTDVDYILNVLPDSKKINNELLIQQQQIRKALEEKQKDLEEKYAAYQKNETTWSEIIRADKQKQLQGMQQDAQEFQQTSQDALQKKQFALIQPVLAKINEAIIAVGKENNYTYVFNRDAGQNTTPVVLYSSSEENNVTNLVLKKLGVDPAVIEKQMQDATNKATQGATAPATAQPKAAAPAPATQPKAATPAPKKN